MYLIYTFLLKMILRFTSIAKQRCKKKVDSCYNQPVFIDTNFKMQYNHPVSKQLQNAHSLSQSLISINYIEEVNGI